MQKFIMEGDRILAELKAGGSWKGLQKSVEVSV